MTLPAAASVLVPSGTAVVWPSDVHAATRVRAMPSGTTVALADRRPGGRGRLRRAAGRLEVRIDAEYLVLPTWRMGTFVVSDDPDAVRWLVETFVTTPPRVALGHALADGAARLGRRAADSRTGAAAVQRLLGALVPGRLVIGTRT